MAGRRRKSAEPDRELVLQGFPRLSREVKDLVASRSKGTKVLVLRLRVLNLLRGYKTLTVRMCFYRLVSLFDYPNDVRFYKRLQYSLKVLRRALPNVNEKFEDPTRPLRLPKDPYRRLELWTEKTALEYMLRGQAKKYHVPILAERGFGSLSMFWKAVRRAARRKVKRILFISDHDPSGLEIDAVTRRETPVQVERIAITIEQIQRYRLPSIRVKRKDSRADRYMEQFGDNAWEVEALPPRALLRIVDRKLKENVPKQVLEEIRLQEEAERVTKPLEKRLIGRIREAARRLKARGIPDEEILRRLSESFGFT